MGRIVGLIIEDKPVKTTDKGKGEKGNGPKK